MRVGLVITPPIIAGEAAKAVAIGDLGGGNLIVLVGLSILTLGCGSGSEMIGVMVGLLKGNERSAGRVLFAFAVAVVMVVPGGGPTSLVLTVSPRSLLPIFITP